MKTHTFVFAVRFFVVAGVVAAPVFADDKEAGSDRTSGQKKTDEVVITTAHKRQGDYSYITESTQKLVETAGAHGDPLAAIFSLPGVVYSGGEGSEPAVRGSSPSDNQYVVDFMPASYIFHEFGVSIFSEYILNDFQMHSAGVGAEYNDVTGAVFDVRLRDPKNQDLGGAVDLSMLRSGLFLEGGITESSSFYLSYRKSLIHLFVKEEDLSDEDEGIILQKTPEDSDYQFKYLWTPSPHHRVSVSANGATDEAAATITEESEVVRSNPDFEGDASLEDRYRGQNIVWEFNDPSGHAFTLGYGKLSDQSNLNWGDDDYILEQEEKQETIKARYRFPLSENFSVAVGAEQAKIKLAYFLDIPLFICTEFDSDCATRRRGRVRAENSITRTQRASYATGVWQPSKKWRVELGGQYQTNDFTGETFVHPRASLSYSLTDKTTLITKSGIYNQFPDTEFIFEETGNPELKSPTSTHYTFGIQQDLGQGWSVVTEAYYKTFSELPLAIGEQEEDAERRYANDTEGEAHGVDIMINKNLTDRLYGWLSFSYGKSTRTNLRTNEKTEYRLDTPLIFNWVLNWQATSSLNFGWRWSVRSGSAYTPIVGVQENPYFEDSVLPIYGDEFSERLPLYNRLDFRLKWDTNTFGKDASLILDIINATNHQNVEERVLDYDQELQPGDEPQTIDIVGMGFQPALTYRVHF